MRDQNLGYAKEQMVIVRCPSIFNPIMYGDSVNTDNRSTSFLDGLRLLSAIKGVTASDDTPGHSMNSRNNMRRGGQDPSFDNSTSILAIQPTFFETYGVDLVGGRTFTEADRFSFNKSNRIILNEKATELLGYNNPNDALHTKVTSRVFGGEYTGEVIGVVKNYHQESLHNDYAPILYYYPENEAWKYFSIRMNTADARQTVKVIESLYTKTFPNDAFEYFFLDEHFNAQYSSDVKFGTIFGSFTLVAIVIACLGLFGLSVFDVTHRVKEIGIRKILGAPVVSILALFSKTSLQILLIAYLIAAPLIYLAANGWLKNFAFTAKPGWQVFILPPLILGCISLATICVVCLQSALMNPTRALRHE
ncbi:FtsX-like permease family protein [Chryseolinea sp. T2]|uniref:ABC transporter permease n=1 Tax=Chryseolinea sp. T2 TaxID=3129255 RepID=UPI003076B957